MMDSWHSYPKIYALGHNAISDLLLDNVIVEEKVDGSQFSFGMFNGELRAKSKSKQLILDAPEKMFTRAIEVIKELPLEDGYTYRAEYLQKPKHNCLTYDRHPENHLIIFDINDGQEKYLSPQDKAKEASRLGLEVVPLLFEGAITNPEQVLDYLAHISCLGRTTIEGVVVKNYNRFGRDGKAYMGKYVSEAFKEKNSKNWKKTNPLAKDIIEQLLEVYKTPARWDKAIQHLKEDGDLKESPEDIGILLKEISKDTKIECEEEIKEILFKWAWSKISRGLTKGFPEYYKQKLLDNQFGDK